MSLPILTQQEIDAICEPLVQGHAQVRFLRGLGLPVDVKPNGKPLVRRADWDRRNMAQATPVNGPKWRVSA
jgi:hypothetical protein